MTFGYTFNAAFYRQVLSNSCLAFIFILWSGFFYLLKIVIIIVAIMSLFYSISDKSLYFTSKEGEGIEM